MEDLSNKIANAKDRLIDDMAEFLRDSQIVSYSSWSDEEKALLRRMASLLIMSDDEETTLAALSVNYAGDSQEVEMHGMDEHDRRNMNRE